MRKIRTLATGRTVAIHHNDGLRKRCGCARRAWNTCGHPWHFSFKLRGGVHFRFPLDKYAEHPIVDRDKALAERDRLRLLIRAGEFPPAPPAPVTPTTPSDLTFETFAERWQTRARASQSENQQANDKGIIKRLSAVELAPGERLGQRPLGLVTLDDLQLAFAQLGPVAGSTWNKYRQALLLMQRWGVKHGYLPRPWITDPKEDLKRQRGARRARRLTPDVLDEQGKVKTPGEERRLIAVSTPWLQRLIIAALETGCRRGELLSLQWAEVSLSRGELTIRAENAKDHQQRHIPISPRLKGVLKMVEHDPAGNPQKDSAHVFGDRIGGKVADPKKAWAKACKAAGVTGLHFHDLRHEAGSRMLEQGWPLHHVRDMLGHADLKTTDNYLNTARHGLHDSMRKFGISERPLHDVAQSTESEPPPDGQQSDASVANVLVN